MPGPDHRPWIGGSRPKTLAGAILKLLRPAWRSIPFHARFRVRRSIRPARWMASLQKPRHRKQILGILERHPGRPVVAYVPHQEWHDLFQRPHQIARAFADRGALVFYFTPGSRRDRRAGIDEIGPGLFLANASYDLLRDLPEAVLILSWLPSRSILGYPRGKLVYEFMDDLEIFYGSGGRIRRDHRTLIRAADLVTVTARSLEREVRDLGVEPLLLPNGVDVVRFKPTGLVPSDLAPILARGQPVIGYQGTLARWFDYDLVLRAAHARPRWQFVLVGPADFDDSWDLPALREQENLHWLGPKAHEALPDYIDGFDVATIPFRINSITRACSPIKLFECLALGKPVVATALEECRGYRGAFIAESPDDYLPALERALEASRDRGMGRECRDEAARNSWESRVEALWRKLFAEGLPIAARAPSTQGPS